MADMETRENDALMLGALDREDEELRNLEPDQAAAESAIAAARSAIDAARGIIRGDE